jgi:hypothetical protein
VCGLVHLLLGEAGDVELAGDGFGDEGIPIQDHIAIVGPLVVAAEQLGAPQIRFAWLRI